MARPYTPNPHKSALTKGINAYLNEVESNAVLGNKGVSLGAIGNGLPAWTTNPDDVEQAIKITREQARTGTPVQRLKRQQRIIELTNALEGLQSKGEDSPRAFFVEHAAGWATDNGVSWGAFRAMGVPPKVLREAGITKATHP